MRRTIHFQPAFRTALIASVALSLAACSGPVPSTGTIDPRTENEPIDETPSATEGAGAPDASTKSADVGKITMEKACGDATFRISRGSGVDANQTTLTHAVADGAPNAINKPQEMDGYTAVGLGCATASDNASYFVVQYGELPFGCKFCEWLYLYDLKGKQLTKSVPPILTDSSLPEGEQQSANTREYQDMIQQLGITHPEVTFIE